MRISISVVAFLLFFVEVISAETTMDTYDSDIHIARSHVLYGRYEAAIAQAEEVLKRQELTDNEKIRANHLIAHALWNSHDRKDEFRSHVKATLPTVHQKVWECRWYEWQYQTEVATACWIDLGVGSLAEAKTALKAVEATRKVRISSFLNSAYLRW